jgi:hypothetical protein
VEEALNRAETAKAAAAGVGRSAAAVANSAGKPAAAAPLTSTKAAAPEFDITAGHHDDGDVV